MSDWIIKAENLGKKYRLQHQAQGQRYTALRDVIAEKTKGLFQKLKLGKQKTETGHAEGPNPFPLSKSLLSTLPATEDFWALKDVSFEIKQGEVVGIIGRNGAGKSTLLKILSRITEPTEGRVTLRGRVASLLEVGTGFHPELTGRENIFLNGAILGMTRAEIRRKFDEIVAFAEVDKFLDTPVKRYSSGMYVRLAFAVAAHLEPEILVVDEVLAVGDSQFQKKCLGKMQDVARGGRTVLFVSHNMNAVEDLCSAALSLEAGRLRERNEDVRSVIMRYLGSGMDGTASSEWSNTQNRYNHPVMRPEYFAIVDAHGEPLKTPVRGDQQIYALIRADVRSIDPALNAGIVIYNQQSDELAWSFTTDAPESEWPKLEVGILEFRCALPKRFFNEGIHRVDLHMSLHCREWFVRPGHNAPSVQFEIQGGLSDSPLWTFARPGMLAPEWKWERTH